MSAPKIPTCRDDDYSAEIVAARRRFVAERTGVVLEHVGHASFPPELSRGNIEHFIGVAQVPVGLAGPLRVNGEHAQGDFYVPLATTEGTLVASYNRGIKVLNQAGGVTTTVVADRMQRAPVFVFASAREARDCADWVDRHVALIREVAEATTRVGRLLTIDAHQSNRFLFLRFNFSTGDASGQNMVTSATRAACEWIRANHSPVVRYYLDTGFATDKKSSRLNMLMTRGKRVTAEATIARQLLIDQLRVTPEGVHFSFQLVSTAAMMSGAHSNGAHSPNAIAAIAIATGQDPATVVESSAALMHTEVTADGDLYVSLTIPSLVVATHGGGTNLPTQRECLQILGCHGKGKVNKLAEIVAAVALAGELSLATAIDTDDWVSAHERHGRNR